MEGERKKETGRKERKREEGKQDREKNKDQEHPPFLSILAIIQLCAFGQVRLL